MGSGPVRREPEKQMFKLRRGRKKDTAWRGDMVKEKITSAKENCVRKEMTVEN